MKITALVENTTARGLRTVHGLSLYIETAAHRLLFDVAPTTRCLPTAKRWG